MASKKRHIAAALARDDARHGEKKKERSKTPPDQHSHNTRSVAKACPFTACPELCTTPAALAAHLREEHPTAGFSDMPYDKINKQFTGRIRACLTCAAPVDRDELSHAEECAKWAAVSAQNNPEFAKARAARAQAQPPVEAERKQDLLKAKAPAKAASPDKAVAEVLPAAADKPRPRADAKRNTNGPSKDAAMPMTEAPTSKLPANMQLDTCAACYRTRTFAEVAIALTLGCGCCYVCKECSIKPGPQCKNDNAKVNKPGHDTAKARAMSPNKQSSKPGAAQEEVPQTPSPVPERSPAQHEKAGGSPAPSRTPPTGVTQSRVKPGSASPGADSQSRAGPPSISKSPPSFRLDPNTPPFSPQAHSPESLHVPESASPTQDETGGGLPAPSRASPTDAARSRVKPGSVSLRADAQSPAGTHTVVNPDQQHIVESPAQAAAAKPARADASAENADAPAAAAPVKMTEQERERAERNRIAAEQKLRTKGVWRPKQNQQQRQENDSKDKAEPEAKEFQCPVADCKMGYDKAAKLTAHCKKKHTKNQLKAVSAQMWASLSITLCPDCSMPIGTSGMTSHKKTHTKQPQQQQLARNADQGDDAAQHLGIDDASQPEVPASADGEEQPAQAKWDINARFRGKLKITANGVKRRDNPAELPTVEELAQHAPTPAELMPELKAPFKEAAHPLLQDLIRAFTTEANRDEAVTRAIVALLMLVPATLSSTRGFLGQRATSGVKDKLQKARLVIEEEEFLTMAVERPRNYVPPADEQTKAVHAAKKQVELGRPGRAAYILTQQSKFADIRDPAVAAAIEQLHPQRSDEPMPELPADAPKIYFDMKKLPQLIKQYDNGAAADIYGWNGNLMRALIEDNEIGAKAFALLFTNIANDTLPESARQYLVARRGIAFQEENKVRPITILSWFAKVALSLTVKKSQLEIAKITAPVNLGIGVPGGPATAFLKADEDMYGKKAAENEPTVKVMLTVDIKAAFPSIDRQWLIKQLNSHDVLKPLRRIVRFLYGHEENSRVYFMDRGSVAKVVESSQGIPQGDEPSSDLFGVAIAPIYAKTLADHPNVAATALHDDFRITGAPADVFAAFETYMAEAKKINLQVQPSKSKLFVPEDHKITEAEARKAQELQIQVVNDAIELYGVPFGGYDIDHLLQPILDGHKKLLDALLHEHMPKQYALTILRHCSLPKANHIIRALPQHRVQQFAQRFDDEIRKAATVILNNDIDIDDKTWLHATLPGRLGGFGLRPVQRTANAAFIAQQFQSHSLLSHLDYPARANAIDHALAELKQAAPNGETIAELPNNTAEATELLNDESPGEGWQKPGLQKNLTADIEQALKQEHFSADAMTQAERARWLSITGPAASAWFTAIPADEDHKLSDRQFVTACRLRLGIQLFSNLPKRCYCHHKVDLKEEPEHLLTCYRSSEMQTEMRHDGIKRIIRQQCKEIGLSVVDEPSNLLPGSQLRPDLLVAGGDNKEIVDVSVTLPTAKSYVDIAAEAQLAAAHKRAADKAKKFEEMARHCRAKMVPFVVEVYGAMTNDTTQFIGRVANAAAKVYTAPDAVDRIEHALKSAVAVQVQKGTAEAAEQQCNWLHMMEAADAANGESNE